jgi:hypothetical protein
MQRRDEAIQTIEGVIAVFAAQNDRPGEGRARAYLAGAYHLAQDLARAEEEAQRALPFLEHAPPYRAPLFGLMALSRADRGDSAGSLAAGTEAKTILDALGGTLEAEAIVRLGFAEGLRASGDVEESKRAIALARDRLLSRAAKIRNPEWRRGFIERLAEHTRILLRAGEWLA